MTGAGSSRRETDMDVTYRSIGIVRSPFTSIEGMPIQPSRAQDVEGTLEIDLEFHAGLKDLDGFSHILLVCHLHRVSGAELTVVPFLDTEPRGIFATRAPKRPNAIAISLLRVKSVNGGRVQVLDVDLLDGTPILDVKPYVPEFDARVDARTGWYARAARKNEPVVSDKRFS
jgi:tRNA-Thr(GGU) m(6)t(6)A37 methyltransferase TsaA